MWQKFWLIKRRFRPLQDSKFTKMLCKQAFASHRCPLQCMKNSTIQYLLSQDSDFFIKVSGIKILKHVESLLPERHTIQAK